MKRFFISVFVVSLLICSFFVVSASAATSDYNWSVREPYFHLVSSSDLGGRVYNVIEFGDMLFQDLTPGGVVAPEAWRNSNSGTPIYSTISTNSASQKRINISSPAFLFPYNTEALDELTITYRILCNTQDFTHGIRYVAQLRTFDKDGNSFNYNLDGYGFTTTSGNNWIEFTFSTAFDAMDRGYIPLHNATQSFRLYLNLYSTEVNHTYPYYPNIEVYDFSSSITMIWNKSYIRSSIIDQDIGDINDGFNGDNYKPIPDGSIDDYLSMEQEVLDRAQDSLAGLSLNFDMTENYFEELGSSFEFFSVLFNLLILDGIAYNIFGKIFIVSISLGTISFLLNMLPVLVKELNDYRSSRGGGNNARTG